FTEETNGKYLIVKESNGNILEANVKNDEGPEDLEEWRIVVIYPIEIPIEEYSLEGTSCLWKSHAPYSQSGKYLIINSNEELEQHLTCTAGNYPEIDFSQYTLLLIYGFCTSSPVFDSKVVYLKNNINNYTMNLTVIHGIAGYGVSWHFAFLVPKITNEVIIAFHVAYSLE
ncbi:MAG: hypothetical protein LBU83_09775, partial [Bacteroidales bacterium]|nr:hypothetical protein [Bacteroidales bacterium]